MILTNRRPCPPDKHAMTMVNNVTGVLNYVIEQLEQILATSAIPNVYIGVVDWTSPIDVATRPIKRKHGLLAQDQSS
jgi:hypothetical protein